MRHRQPEVLYKEFIDRLQLYTIRDGGMYRDVANLFFSINCNISSNRALIDLVFINKSIKKNKERVYYDSSGI